MTLDEAHRLTKIDPWFLAQFESMAADEQAVAAASADWAEALDFLGLKRRGMADRRMVTLLAEAGLSVTEADIRAARKARGVVPVYKRVDTCAAEFAADTPYLYSTFESECEAAPTDRKKIVILGGGPNRIGQGIEFDYCCVHAVMALATEGYEAIMVNCNPETVSTDYDTSDRLFFEPLTLEDVVAICESEKPEGVIVQFGGQTPLRLSVALEEAGVRVLGTSADAIDRAEDRERFGQLLDKLKLLAPAWGVARSLDEAREVAESIGYPVMVRPSYVLGGRAMERIWSRDALDAYFVKASEIGLPLLIDQFLSDAVELDVDVLADASGGVIVGGVMEHIEEAGVHSGDSACSLPPLLPLSKKTIAEIERQGRDCTCACAKSASDLMNVQVRRFSDERHFCHRSEPARQRERFHS